jgi:hypothetical protein
MKDSTKKFWKSVLIFAAGATIGALVAYEISRRKYETEYFDDDYEPRNKIKADKDFNPGNTIDDEVKIVDISKDRYRKTIKNLGYNRDESINPAELESPPEDKNDEEDEYESEKISYDTNGDEPHIISLEEFAEEKVYYDKITLSFYEDDEVLTDEGEEIIDDPVALVGEDALQSFGVMSEDPEVVYVRNDNLQIDYEIIRLSKSYQETVMGT